MKTWNLPCEIFRSLAGLVIGATGIFRLFTHLVGATQQLTRTLDQTSAARMQLLSWIMLASSFNAHRLEHDLLSALWPLLPSLMGSVLLWSAASRQSTQDRRPCTRWA